MTPLEQHQLEIKRNQKVWRKKPLLRQLYAEFYQRIAGQIDRSLAGPIVEIGSGMGNLKTWIPEAICTDIFPNPWLDLVCDAYEMPFRDGTVSHLILVDVFHHLRAPKAFLREARRVLVPNGRVILLEPYISLLSFPAYALHHEGVNWRNPIFMGDSLPSRDYYTGQGNVTRLFFSDEYRGWLEHWNVLKAERFVAIRYLLSGGCSKPAMYPERCLPMLKWFDDKLSRWPKLFGVRCMLVLQPQQA